MEKNAEDFLFDLLSTPSPTGFEAPGQRKWAAYARRFADSVESDAYGNVWATVKGANPEAPTLMLEAHADEIGLHGEVRHRRRASCTSTASAARTRRSRAASACASWVMRGRSWG
jgi:hypothetical protein